MPNTFAVVYEELIGTKNNIQIIVATTFVLLIVGGVWGMIDHHQGFMRQLIQDRLRDYNLAFWEASSQDAEKLLNIGREKESSYIGKNANQIRVTLAEQYYELNNQHDIHHLAFYGKDTKLKRLQNHTGLSLDRHSLYFLNLPDTPSS